MSDGWLSVAHSVSSSKSYEQCSCRFLSGDGSWSPSSNVLRCVSRHRATMNLHCCHGMRIHHRCRRANMSRHRCCCAILSLILNMTRAIHCAAQVDCSEAHCAASADCIWARPVAQAMNYPAVLAALRWADADRAEACCFRQSCHAMHGQLGPQRKFQALNRDQQLKCDQKPGPSLNRDRRWKEISAIHRFPACAKSGQRRDQTIATSRN